MDACITGCSAICHPKAYHAKFPPHVLVAQHPIGHPKMINALVVLRRWAPRLKGQLIQLHNDNYTCVPIFQASKGRDAFIEARDRELWLMFAKHDITLSATHTPGVVVTASPNTLSHWHRGSVFRDRVNQLVKDKAFILVFVDNDYFNVSAHL